MTPWLERWLQRDDDELLYGDQSDVTLEDLAQGIPEFNEEAPWDD